MIKFRNFFLINELSEENLKKIVSDIDPEDLPFNDIFEGDYRIVYDEEFQVIHPDLEIFKDSLSHKYEFNFDDGTVRNVNGKNSQKITKFVKSYFESLLKKNFGDSQSLIKRLQIIVYQSMGGLRMHPILNKVLWDEYKDELINYYANHESFADSKAGEFFRDVDKKISYKQALSKAHINLPVYIAHWSDSFNDDRDKKIARTLATKYHDQLKYAFAKELTGHEVVGNLVNSLNKLIQNYRIVYSRHPIDILRMSDFKNIQSCHSPDGSYFDCAIQEANDGGVIAYLINDKDYRKFENKLQDKEFFYDSERGVDGVKPEGRIRLRTFTNTEKNITLMIPEQKIYGKFSNTNIGKEFYKEVLQWARDIQDAPKLYNTIVDHDDRQSVNLENGWQLKGGHYEDTASFQLFNDLFEPEIIQAKNNFKTYSKFVGEAIKGDNVNRREVWQEEADNFYNVFRHSTNSLITAPPVVSAHGQYVNIEFREPINFSIPIEKSFIVNHNDESKTIHINDGSFKDVLFYFIRELFSNLKDSGFYGWGVVSNIGTTEGVMTVYLNNPEIHDPDHLNDYYMHLHDTVFDYWDTYTGAINYFINNIGSLYERVLNNNETVLRNQDIIKFITEIVEKVHREVIVSHIHIQI